MHVPTKEPLIECTIGCMTAWCPRSTLTSLSDTRRVSLRDALPGIPLSHEIRGSLTGEGQRAGQQSGGWRVLRLSLK